MSSRTYPGWTPARLGRLDGVRAVVTGASNGVGLETARELARCGADVVLAVRDTALGRRRADEIGGRTEVRRLDLADLASVRAFAADLDGEIDLLINNAGVFPLRQERTTDGFGVGMRLFSLTAPVAGSAVVEFLFFVTLIALANTVGVLAGAIYLRWRAVGLWATGLLLTVLLGVVVVVFTWQGWWVPVGSAIADSPRPVTMVLLPLALTAPAAPGVWAVLRRTTV